MRPCLKERGEEESKRRHCNALGWVSRKADGTEAVHTSGIRQEVDGTSNVTDREEVTCSVTGREEVTCSVTGREEVTCSDRQRGGICH